MARHSSSTSQWSLSPSILLLLSLPNSKTFKLSPGAEMVRRREGERDDWKRRELPSSLAWLLLHSRTHTHKEMGGRSHTCVFTFSSKLQREVE